MSGQSDNVGREGGGSEEGGGLVETRQVAWREEVAPPKRGMRMQNNLRTTGNGGLQRQFGPHRRLGSSSRCQAVSRANRSTMVQPSWPRLRLVKMFDATTT